MTILNYCNDHSALAIFCLLGGGTLVYFFISGWLRNSGENGTIDLILSSMERAKKFSLVKDMGIVWALGRDADICCQGDVDYADPRLISLLLSDHGFGRDFVAAARLGRVYQTMGKLDDFLTASNQFLYQDISQCVVNSLKMAIMHVQITGQMNIQSVSLPTANKSRFGSLHSVNTGVKAA